jgi:CDP-glycerol glycerophosphotransferase
MLARVAGSPIDLALHARSLITSTLLPYVRRSQGRKVVLTSFHGHGYRGNPRILFEAMIADGVLDPVWLATDAKVVDRVRERFGAHRAELSGSNAGNRALADAKVVVLSHGTSDLPWIHINRRAAVLQSWHGLPTKTGELLDGGLGPIDRLRLRARWHAVDVMLSSSPLVSSIYAARFGLRREQLLELGYPDHDRLCSRSSAPPRLDAAPPFEKLILYAPTFRKRAETRLLPFADLDVLALDRVLEAHRAILAIRPHPNDRLGAQELCARSPRFVLADDRAVEDVVPLVLAASMIVTDYSGIFLDGLLSDTPCAFVPYDLGEYERGIPWDYAENTPGPKVADQAGFVAACTRALETPQADAQWRARVRTRFFTHTDGRATQRVLAWIENAVALRR